MARRRKSKHLGGSESLHADRARLDLHDMRRLSAAVRKRLKAPADCEGAALLVLQLARVQGAYLIDRGDSRPGRAGYGGKGPTAVLGKFVQACVVKPKSAAAKRKIHAVWR